MVTIEELRETVKIEIGKASALQKEMDKLNNFLSFIKNLISEDNEFNSTIDIDALIAQQTPKYNNLKSAVTTAYNNFK